MLRILSLKFKVGFLGFGPIGVWDVGLGVRGSSFRNYMRDLWLTLGNSAGG